MTGSEYLQRLAALQADISELNSEIQMIYDTRPAAGFDYTVGSGNSYSDVTGDAAVKVAKLSADRDRLLLEWLNLYEAVTNVLEAMPDRNQRQILTLRYILCYTWQQIGAFTEYCQKQCYRIHNKAIEAFNTLWESAGRNQEK